MGVPEQIEHTPVLCGLATNPSLPAELVDVLIRDGDDEILTDLVERTDLTEAQTAALVARCDPSMIALLVRHGLAEAEPRHFDDPAIAIQLIGCGLGTPEILARLAHDPDVAIRRLVADEITLLPEEITRTFAVDIDVRVVAAVAGWGELPDDVARALARHPDREVRSELASNPSGTVPPDVLVELLTTGGDAPITTCGACRANPSPDERCHTHSAGLEVIRSYALRNESTPVVAILEYVDADDASDRATLAAREDLPPTLLARLADDIEDFVRTAVAENPSTPADILRTLACDASVKVRRAVGSNPNIPLDLLFDLVLRTRLPLRIPRLDRATEHELRGIASSRSARVRALAAARPDLPDDLCTTLTDDPDPGVAKHLADRPRARRRRPAATRGPPRSQALQRDRPEPELPSGTAAHYGPQQPDRAEGTARDRQASGRRTTNPDFVPGRPGSTSTGCGQSCPGGRRTRRSRRKPRPSRLLHRCRQPIATGRVDAKNRLSSCVRGSGSAGEGGFVAAEAE